METVLFHKCSHKEIRWIYGILCSVLIVFELRELSKNEMWMYLRDQYTFRGDNSSLVQLRRRKKQRFIIIRQNWFIETTCIDKNKYHRIFDCVIQFKVKCSTDVYSEPSETCKIEILLRLINSFHFLTVFEKDSILHVWQGSEHAFVIYKSFLQHIVDSLLNYVYAFTGLKQSSD